MSVTTSIVTFRSWMLNECDPFFNVSSDDLYIKLVVIYSVFLVLTLILKWFKCLFFFFFFFCLFFLFLSFYINFEVVKVSLFSPFLSPLNRLDQPLFLTIIFLSLGVTI